MRGFQKHISSHRLLENEIRISFSLSLESSLARLECELTRERSWLSELKEREKHTPTTEYEKFWTTNRMILQKARENNPTHGLRHHQYHFIG